MKTRVVILAGGEGTRLSVLTAKRAKPAVPFAGKYRIIDFTLSNCVNSRLFDVMILAQYRPHSLIEHIGAGGPWDLNRDFTGGVRIYTPYRATQSNWYVGTADAVQQNFNFIKRGDPDLIMILSGDHIYSMDYDKLIHYHIQKGADLTMASIVVPMDEASRFGIVAVDEDNRVTNFVEKPAKPPSNLANMGVYVFNRSVLGERLWNDHFHEDSKHDFGKNIIPDMLREGYKIYAYPFSDYWMDVGTVESYWQAQMDLLTDSPTFDLYNPNWIIHTRTEERPPVRIHRTAIVEDSLICDGCTIGPGAKVIRSILSPGVHVQAGSHVEESIILTDTNTGEKTSILRSIIDKRIQIGSKCQIGALDNSGLFSLVGRNSILPAGLVIEPGGIIGTDVADYEITSSIIRSGEQVVTKRLPYEI